jgi:hypothetical protein
VRRSVAALGLLGALGLAAGCGSGESGKPTGARLEARWTGADTAAFGAPATAEWCDSLNLLEILAIAGDTGIEIALYPRDGVAPGAYPVRPPAAADSLTPSAAVGLRWFAQTSVQGFQGDSGQVSLTRAPDGTLSGRFRATARAISGKGRLTITGSFADLRQRPATSGCSTVPPPPRAAPADPGEDGVD